MNNLLEETIESLTKNGKTPTDVLWVGSSDGKLAINWDEFAAIANFEYNLYGGQEIPTDLVIVGERWWLERDEYAGAEYWVYKFQPSRSLDAKKFNYIKQSDFWVTLAKAQG